MYCYDCYKTFFRDVIKENDIVNDPRDVIIKKEDNKWKIR